MLMVRNYKKYLEPHKLTDREEITSHSSLLTNRRLDIMFLRLDDVGVEAWSNICVPNIKAYFSVLRGIYNNVFSVFDEEENEEIKKYFGAYNKMFFSLFQEFPEVNRYKVCYEILFVLDHLQKMIIGFLQKRQFFFRMGKPNIKGIEQALALYKKRGKMKGK